MAINDKDLEFVKDQLSGFGDFTARKMFGGAGFSRDKIMFGMIDSSGVFRLKADEKTKRDFEKHGMKPLTMDKPKMKGTMPYWQVPVEVLEDRTELKKWAEKGYEVAVRKKKK